MSSFSFSISRVARILPRTQFEFGNESTNVRNSCRSQIWCAKHELLRFALQFLSPTLNLALHRLFQAERVPRTVSLQWIVLTQIR